MKVADMVNKINAVVIDAFGTTIQTVPRTGVYHKVLSQLKDYRDARFKALTTNADLDAIARDLGLSPVETEDLQLLHQEIASLKPYDDTTDFIDRCLADNLKIGVCSNLAYHYGDAVRSLLPKVKHFTFSFEIGAIKPQREIYEHVCTSLGSRPEEIVFIGDTPLADKIGPDAFGMRGVLLKRREGDTLTSALERALSK